MTEVLVKFTEPVRGRDGRGYDAQACGGVASDGLWEGWIEFALPGEATSIRTGRETGQPNRTDLEYWAQGLTQVYLEGALGRALGEASSAGDTEEAPEFELRAGSGHRVINARPALNPFLVYAEGEEFLRGQLLGLSREELATIVQWYHLPVLVNVETASPAAIVDDIARTLQDARRPQRSTAKERRAG